mgnify:CR=1 FL=1
MSGGGVAGGPITGGARLDALGAADDAVAAFQIEDEPVRGRIARLADSLDEILGAHDYPDAVARLLGEAVIAAALVGHSLKFEGRLVVQASGDGPVSFLVADYRTEGAVRAYARVDPARRAEIGDGWGASRLLGTGTLALTIDPLDEKERYQGVVELQGDSLSDAVEYYFRQSEQVPTRVRIAVARFQAAGLPHWRGGGMIIQQIAGDAARGDAAEAWNTARALFDTLSDEELVDPDLSGGRVLFRLFHETGVRLFDPAPLRRYCQCSAERVKTVLASFPAAEREAMAQDGAISAACEYCNTTYRFAPEDLE